MLLVGGRGKHHQKLERGRFVFGAMDLPVVRKRSQRRWVMAQMQARSKRRERALQRTIVRSRLANTSAAIWLLHRSVSICYACIQAGVCVCARAVRARVY